MEKIMDAALGLIEVVLFTGANGFGGAIGLRAFHDEVRKNTIEVLKRPSIAFGLLKTTDSTELISNGMRERSASCAILGRAGQLLLLGD